MKKLALFFLSLLLFFAVGFGVGRFVPFSSASYVKQEVETEEAKRSFQAASHPLVHRPFVLAILGRNQAPLLQKTLSSALSQQYENFRILCVDDASDDGSFELLGDLACDNPRAVGIELLRNETPLGEAASLYRIAESCREEEILAVLKAGDWLPHEWVLETLNRYYADPAVWITYGRFCTYPTFQKGGNPSYEGQERFDLKTFYAALFKKIRREDLLKARSQECTYMLPLLEMAGQHSAHLCEILYVSSRFSEEENRISPKEGRELYSALSTLFSQVPPGEGE